MHIFGVLSLGKVDGNSKTCLKNYLIYLRWFSTCAKKGVGARVGRWKHVCRVSCDVANTKVKWWLFMLMASLRSPQTVPQHGR